MNEFIDFPIEDKVNAVGGTLIVIASYIFGAHWELFMGFLLLNVIDYITGVMKSRINHTESSSAGLKGIIKKFSYWVMILLAFTMGNVFNEIGATIGSDFSAITPIIGWYTLATSAINEFRSILENLVECGIDVPPALITGLKVAVNVLKRKESMFDGNIDLKDHAVSLDTSDEELKEKGVVTLKITTVGEDSENDG